MRCIVCTSEVCDCTQTTLAELVSNDCTQTEIALHSARVWRFQAREDEHDKHLAALDEARAINGALHHVREAARIAPVSLKPRLAEVEAEIAGKLRIFVACNNFGLTR